MPLGILYIGLPSRHILDVTGIDHPEGEFLLQKVVNGLPKDPGTPHGHVSDLKRAKPIREQQVFGHCPELANLFPLGSKHAGHHRFLVYIQTTAALIEDSHFLIPKPKLPVGGRPIFH